VVLFLSTQHVPVGLDVGIAEYFVLPVLGLAVAFLALWLLRRGRYRTALLLASVSAVPGVLLFIANSLVIVMNAGIDVAMY